MGFPQNLTRNASNISKESENLSCYHFNNIHFSLGDISPAWYIFSCVIDAVFTSTATFINLLLLVAIRKTPSLHSPSNTLLFGLALSDLGVGLIVQPLFFMLIVGKITRNKDLFCEAGIAVEISANALCIISLLTATAVSLDRYLALKLHLRYKQLITIQRVTLLIGIIWLVGAFIGSLWLYKPDMVKLSVLTTIAVCLVAAVFSYFKIYRVVSRHYFCNMTLKRAVQQEHVEQAVNMAKFKSHALSIFWVYCLIIVCYFPYFCVVIVITLTRLTTTKRFFYEMMAILIFINSSLNPLVYCWRLRDIRHAVQKTTKLLLKLPWKTNTSKYIN